MKKYQKVRESIREIMQDGKVHTAEELYKECEKRGIEISANRSEIYNVVHQLKKKGEIESDIEKGYILKEKKEGISFGGMESNSSSMQQSDEQNVIKTFELDDFEVVKPATRKAVKQVVSVLENGDLALNSALCKKLNTNKLEIHIKKDCSQIVLVPGGKVLLDVTKNNRIKNYIIYEKLEKKKIKFPVYYVGEWDEERAIWMGNLVMTNPNKTIGKVMK